VSKEPASSVTVAVTVTTAGGPEAVAATGAVVVLPPLAIAAAWNAGNWVPGLTAKTIPC